MIGAYKICINNKNIFMRMRRMIYLTHIRPVYTMLSTMEITFYMLFVGKYNNGDDIRRYFP